MHRCELMRLDGESDERGDEESGEGVLSHEFGSGDDECRYVC